MAKYPNTAIIYIKIKVLIEDSFNLVISLYYLPILKLKSNRLVLTSCIDHLDKGHKKGAYFQVNPGYRNDCKHTTLPV
jgi:hypothetical protein